ncbi:MAG: UDP-3-O-(3-hydroxymyristoyl)glucosamine N-acyltransferase [bacterium]
MGYRTSINDWPVFPVWIDTDAKIADSVVLGPFVYIGREVEVGPETVLGPGVVVWERVKIGCRVRIGPGAVIGWGGFGYKKEGGRLQRLEHNGWVIIEDDVEIGPNVIVAQAKNGRETVIGQGTKIDALVHIAHNVKIGKNCVIVAQSGLAGSVVIGDDVIIAGQSGVKDHVKIGSGSVIYAKSAVFRSIPDGARYWGIPARPYENMMRFWARLWQTFGKKETVIGQGTKIDALVHIAHNVKIGKNCVIVAQSGLAGSVVIGDDVIIAGQSGVKDHVKIGSGSVIYAKSAVFRSIPDGARYWGIPARPYENMMRFWARLWQTFGKKRDG